MLLTTDSRSVEALPQAVACADRAPSGEIADLIGQLEALRVVPRLLRANGRITAGGAMLRIPVRKVLRSPLILRRVTEQIAALLREGVPMTVSLLDLGGDDRAIESLEDFCTALARFLSAENLSPDPIGISLQSHLLPLQAYLLICTALLGHGPRYVMLDSLQMRHHENRRVQRETDSNWSFLWRRRAGSPTLLPAYAASVTTRCPLLGDEAATAILPELGIQVPIDTAWLPLTLHLPDFSDGRGRLCWKTLERALKSSVDLADRIMDRLWWPEDAQHRDALQNRRLAITVGGIGDLVVERGADPADLRCLQWIDRTILHLRTVLWSRSRAHARKAQPLPALLQTEPAAGWQNSAEKSGWQLRWRQAVQASAVRHRNLLVLSPYAVLPAAGDGVAAFVDLLPVLKHADAFSFACPKVPGYRDSREFANFHRRAWAVMQRRNAASFVAAGA